MQWRIWHRSIGGSGVSFLLIAVMAFAASPGGSVFATTPPPSPTIEEIYSGTDSQGSLDIVNIKGTSRNDLTVTFYAVGGQVVTLRLNILTGQRFLTFPSGQITVTPQANGNYQETLSVNGGQQWQVLLDSQGNIITAGGDTLVQQAAAAIGQDSSAALGGLKAFLLQESLVVQNPDGTLSVSRDECLGVVAPKWLACGIASIGLAAAIAGLILGCGTVSPACLGAVVAYNAAVLAWAYDCFA
ncbi:MAG: hypothetical protein WBS54_05760 [Acidobacteriota bacterium]